MKSTKKIKIAFVHDDFIQFGGAEKLIFETILEFSKAEDYEVCVYSSLISNNWKKLFFKNKITFSESFLNKIPFCYKLHKLFFITDLFYMAFSDFDFSDLDIVFSSSTRFGHFLITKPTTYHISYINSPARALWDERKYFFGKKFLYLLIKNFFPKKRVYDYYSQQLSDVVISNSKNIRKKVKKFYKRNSLVAYPYFTINSKSVNSDKSEYFLLISRLTSWKRIDYVIDSFNKTGQNLIIVGEGPEFKRYKSISKKNIEYYGYVLEEKKADLLANAKALIFPQNEDFGITLLEAVYYNCPIIYLNKGGAKEILNKGLGVSFQNQNAEDLSFALNQIDDFNLCSKSRDKFLALYSKDLFIRFIEKLLKSKLGLSSIIV